MPETLTIEIPDAVGIGRCDKCAFWEPEESYPGMGDCRRRAPQLVVINDICGETSRVESRWPFTRDNEGCGEFKSKQ